MTHLTPKLPQSPFAPIHPLTDQIPWEMRIPAAVKWFELRQVSDRVDTDIAGLTRAALIEALSLYRISSLQYPASDLTEGLDDGH